MSFHSVQVIGRVSVRFRAISMGLPDKNILLSKHSFAFPSFLAGNDFARALFWSARFQDDENPKSELRQLVYQWMSAETVLHDLWDVSVELKSSGTFKKVDPKTRYKVRGINMWRLLRLTGNWLWTIKRNYF